MRGLKDKVVIVTGAGRGIGRATAQRFCEEGSRVVIAELSEELGQGAAEELRAEGFEASFVQVNVSDRASVQAMVGAVKERYGQIDALINNAGILADKTLRKLTDEDFDCESRAGVVRSSMRLRSSPSTGTSVRPTTWPARPA